MKMNVLCLIWFQLISFVITRRALLLILKVVYTIRHSFARMLGFSLWMKHGGPCSGFSRVYYLWSSDSLEPFRWLAARNLQCHNHIVTGETASIPQRHWRDNVITIADYFEKIREVGMRTQNHGIVGFNSLEHSANSPHARVRILLKEKWTWQIEFEN